MVFKKLSAAVLVLLLCLTAISANAAEMTDIKNKSDETANRLQSCQTPIVGSIGGEWLVIGLARSEKISAEMAQGYYNNVLEYVSANNSAKLHRSKSTDNSRVILALTSIGKDVTDVSGFNLLEPLADFDYVKRQGINGPIWALIALDCNSYDIPETNANNPTTREKLIEYILDNQTPVGCWDLSKEIPDPDLTGMASTALAPYYNTNNNVKTAVDNALEYMSDNQKESGFFKSGGADTPESCAQMIVGLSSLGVDINTDNRFIKNGSVFDALLTFSVEGGFCHETGGEYNQMSTEQSFYALTSYNRFSDNKTPLYDMSDVSYDIDSNLRIDVSDALLIQKQVACFDVLSPQQKVDSDINQDGYVTISDVTSLQRYIAGMGI